MLFGSGDGGWGQIENRVCKFLQQNAFYTVGIDFRKYAATDYDPKTLVSDFTVIAAIAWWLAVILLSLATLLQFARGPALHHVVLSLGILILLICRRRDYVAASDQPSMRWALIIGLPFLFAVIVYGVVGLLRLRAEVVGKNNFRAASRRPWS
jgi:Bacterial virulence protein (VirJ)